MSNLIRKLGEQAAIQIGKMFDNLEARLDAKSAALDKFGRHLPGCASTKPANMREDLRDYQAKCDCGFDDAKGA